MNHKISSYSSSMAHDHRFPVVALNSPYYVPIALHGPLGRDSAGVFLRVRSWNPTKGNVSLTDMPDFGNLASRGFARDERGPDD